MHATDNSPTVKSDVLVVRILPRLTWLVTMKSDIYLSTSSQDRALFEQADFYCKFRWGYHDFPYQDQGAAGLERL